MHVLVIQSNPSIQLGLAYLIRTFGLSVDTAKSVCDAPSKIAPDVLIVDDVSALKFGLTKLHSLWQELEPRPDIILTTGSGMVLDEVYCDDYFKLIQHPLNAEALEHDLRQIKLERESFNSEGS